MAEQMPNSCARVVLLHGLLLTSLSMRPVARHLRQCGHRTICLGYPSRKEVLPLLARHFLAPLIEDLRRQQVSTIHFVTHSMGGVLLRCYLAENHLPEMGRVVMISPPNRGSELVDFFNRFRWFRSLFGPAACQLETARETLPSQLGPFPAGYLPDCLGIVTGDKTILPFWDKVFHGPSDGRVSVASAQLAGMNDFLVLPQSHVLILCNQEAQKQIAFFLEHGHFLHKEQPSIPE